MPLPELIDIAHKHLFSPREEMAAANLPVPVQSHLERLRSVYSYWEANPALNDREMVRHIKNVYKVSDVKARQDLRLIKTLLGDFHESSKAWHRFRFEEMFLEAFELAKKKGSVRDMVAALGQYGRYMQLDQKDVEAADYSDLKPTQLKPTDDPTVIGIALLPNARERIKALKAKYWNDTIEDITPEEIDYNPDDIFKPTQQ